MNISIKQKNNYTTFDKTKPALNQTINLFPPNKHLYTTSPNVEQNLFSDTT